MPALSFALRFLLLAIPSSCAPPAESPTAPAAREPALPWAPVRLDDLGLMGELPGPGEPVDEMVSMKPLRVRVRGLRATARGLEFRLERLDRLAPLAPLSDQQASPDGFLDTVAGVGPGERRRAFREGGFAGYEIERASAPGETVIEHVVLVGGHVLRASVRARAVPFDRAAAARFFASAHPTFSFSLHALEAGQAVIAAPSWAAHAAEPAEGGVMHTFWMGGVNALNYSLYLLPLKDSVLESDTADAIVARGVTWAVRNYDLVKAPTTLTVRGQPARELVVQSGGLFMRQRVVVGSGVSIVLGVASRDRAELDDAKANLFLDSIAWPDGR